MWTVIIVLHLLCILLLFHGAHGSEAIYFPNDHGDPIKVPIKCRSPREVHVEADLKSKVRFYLYTRMGSRVDKRQMRIGEPLPENFLRDKTSKILIHGFINTLKSKMIQNIKDAYLEPHRNTSEGVNVIAVDWGDLAGLSTMCYIGPKENTKPVGRYVAQFIQALVSTGALDLHHVHVIGHSLGAHVAGIAGKNMQTGKVARITGLDPAGVLYGSEPEGSRLVKTDAEFVDVIHTDIQFWGLGFKAPCGHVDFYPHGGRLQPKCLLHSCSHSRAHEYYAASVRDTSNYRAYSCGSLSDVTACSEERLLSPTGCTGCTVHPDNFMGDRAMLVSKSVFFSNPEPSFSSDWEEWGMWTLIGLSGLVVVGVCVGVGVRAVKRRRANDDPSISTCLLHTPPSSGPTPGVVTA